MFVRYWLMKLAQNLQRRNVGSMCVLVAQSWEHGMLTSTLISQSSFFMLNSASLDLWNLEKGWLSLVLFLSSRGKKLVSRSVWGKAQKNIITKLSLGERGDVYGSGSITYATWVECWWLETGDLRSQCGSDVRDGKTLFATAGFLERPYEYRG